MKFQLIIDKEKDEEVVATVHRRSALTDEIKALVLKYAGADRIPAYTEDDGKTYAIDFRKRRYRLKQRLYELEEILPASFIRITKNNTDKINQKLKNDP